MFLRDIHAHAPLWISVAHTHLIGFNMQRVAADLRDRLLVRIFVVTGKKKLDIFFNTFKNILKKATKYIANIAAMQFSQ